MVFLENSQFLTDLSMEIWATLMFVEKILSLFLVFLNQFLMGIQSTWVGVSGSGSVPRNGNAYRIPGSSEREPI